MIEPVLRAHECGHRVWKYTDHLERVIILLGVTLGNMIEQNRNSLEWTMEGSKGSFISRFRTEAAHPFSLSCLL